MSIKLMTQIWEVGPQKQGELLVLLAISDHADDDGYAWPSMARIAKKARMLERSAQRIVRQLEADGWLTIQTGNGRHGCNQYRINPVQETPSECHPVQETPRPKRQKPRPKVQETPSDVSPEPSGTINNRQSARDVLLSILRADTVDAFLDLRKAKRAPMTVKAAELIVKKLAGHSEPDAVVEKSIESGWTGVFPDKVKPSQFKARIPEGQKGLALPFEIVR